MEHPRSARGYGTGFQGTSNCAARAGAWRRCGTAKAWNTMEERRNFLQITQKSSFITIGLMSFSILQVSLAGFSLIALDGLLHTEFLRSRRFLSCATPTVFRKHDSFPFGKLLMDTTINL
ncbi:unnamed protein product [Kuraishia capsulata CBS 1993]|uniref:Uncharacterized protein n=1 Tax=Kuraishia capsulata CBS 1993 TaxID=1382522 RepID=W6MTI2_9ASCO|nr:uncharacterized protein KUCA_T00006034001 [Kuraishia capsulata CBS 1993]CDK30039.1 unnamed protein product [Kuraishia capsulata CBS 1993]